MAPRWLARFNRRVTNRALGPLARYLPMFGVVEHRGRRTGRVHRTPVNVFARPGGCVIALTYGPGSEWVKNVLAAGMCQLESGGRKLQLTEPRLVRDESRRVVPPLVRLPLGLLGVDYFLELRAA